MTDCERCDGMATCSLLWRVPIGEDTAETAGVGANLCDECKSRVAAALQSEGISSEVWRVPEAIR